MPEVDAESAKLTLPVPLFTEVALRLNDCPATTFPVGAPLMLICGVGTVTAKVMLLGVTAVPLVVVILVISAAAAGVDEPTVTVVVHEPQAVTGHDAGL